MKMTMNKHRRPRGNLWVCHVKYNTIKIRVQEPSLSQASLTRFVDKYINDTLKRNEASEVSS